MTRTCQAPAGDVPAHAPLTARLCGRPATTSAVAEGVTFVMCAACARALGDQEDTMDPMRLACDPDQPASRLMDLWDCAGREMKEHLAANPSSPEGVLHEALGDEEAHVRYLAARTLMRRALINAGMGPGLRDRIERELRIR